MPPVRLSDCAFASFRGVLASVQGGARSARMMGDAPAFPAPCPPPCFIAVSVRKGVLMIKTQQRPDTAARTVGIVEGVSAVQDRERAVNSKCAARATHLRGDALL